MLEPLYGPEVERVLDAIEQDPARDKLWHAICDTIDLVCERPGSAEARAVRLSGAVTEREPVFQVRVRVPSEDDDWIVIWHQRGSDAVFAYVGPLLK